MTLVPSRRGVARVSLLFLLTVLAVLSAPGAARAQEMRPVPSRSGDTAPVADGALPRRGPIDRGELEAFLDGLMAAHRGENRVAGATVAVVRDGELLFSKGYGWADEHARRPVDPATTLFRIGSVTKLFTWTAIMQLRDEGLLDLDADVNEYLDFRIPDTYPEPITLRHLLTHTPGFEDRVFGLFGAARDVERGAWLRDQMPARVRPPGRHSAYSNFGVALAGYIVERTAGMPWEQYIESRILEPLGMTSATGREPLPERLRGQMSNGYTFVDARFEAKPFEFLGAIAPAGSVSASAEAMAAFMIAHLEHGGYGDRRILADTTVREMHTRAFAADPRANGMALGFYEVSSHGRRIIAHGGGTQWFFTDLFLIPEERLGVFVSYNSAGAAQLGIMGFRKAFLDHYYPMNPVPRPAPAPGWEERAAAYAGNYWFLRRPYTTFEKPIGLLMQIRVAPIGPGEITVRSHVVNESLLEIEPGHFRARDGFLEATFADDGTARPQLYLSIVSAQALEKVRTRDGAPLHMLTFLFWFIVMMSVLVTASLRWLLQRRFAEVQPHRGPSRIFRWAAVVLAALAVAFPVAIGTATADLEAFMSGAAGTGIQAALVLPVLAVPLTIAVVVGAILGFRRGYWSRTGRVHFAAVAVAAIVYLAQLHFWNLLGWRF